MSDPNFTCHNCHTPAPGKFCPECGQETTLHPPSVFEFFHEFLSHYIAAEGKLWRTLLLLAVKPGQLTVEYLAGRRRRYIIPLRLYLTASFVFFALSQLVGYVQDDNAHLLVSSDDAAELRDSGVHFTAGLPHTGTPFSVTVHQDKDKDTPAVDVSAIVDDLRKTSDLNATSGTPDVTAVSHMDWTKPCTAEQECSPLHERVSKALANLKRDPKPFVDRFAERFRHLLSYAMFCLLPVFAGLLALAYWNRTMNYGEHLVFALHVHAFWFVLAMVTLLLPDAIGDWLPLVGIGYGVWAMSRVYGGRIPWTLMRAVFVYASYLFCIAIGAAGVSLYLLTT